MVIDSAPIIHEIKAVADLSVSDALKHTVVSRSFLFLFLLINQTLELMAIKWINFLKKTEIHLILGNDRFQQ